MNKSLLIKAAATFTVAAGFVTNVCAQFQPMRPGVDREVRYAAEISYAAPSDLHLGTRNLGDMSSFQYRASIAPWFRASETYVWSIGAEFQNVRFSLPAGAPAPDALYAATLKLGNQWRMAEDWTLISQVSPGLYSDFEDISWGDFNAPLLVMAEYSTNPDLQWYFGAQANFRRDVPVYPALGARWKFAEAWVLQASFPSPRLERRINDVLTAHVGVDFTGGSHRVGEAFGTSVGRPALNGEDVSYREWRAGAGIRWRAMENLGVQLGAGYLIDRRFHYEDADLQLNGDGAPYVQFSVNGSF